MQEYRNGTETVTSCLPHVTSRHDHQRVPYSFRQQPTSSTRPDICQRAPHSFSKQGTGKTQDSTALRYHVCRVSALCPVHNFRSHSNQTMSCATHTMNVHVSHHCRCHVLCTDWKQLLCKNVMSKRVPLQCRCPSCSWPSWTPCRTGKTR